MNWLTYIQTFIWTSCDVIVTNIGLMKCKSFIKFSLPPVHFTSGKSTSFSSVFFSTYFWYHHGVITPWYHISDFESSVWEDGFCKCLLTFLALLGRFQYFFLTHNNVLKTCPWFYTSWKSLKKLSRKSKFEVISTYGCWVMVICVINKY